MSIKQAIILHYLVTLETIMNMLNFLRIIKRRTVKLPESLEGKTVVITGANSGIGKVTAINCAQLGAKVYIACRDLEKADQCLIEIKEKLDKDQQNNIEAVQLNLSSLKSVRECAKKLNQKLNCIDYLINNAGIMMCSEMKSEDGFELQLATNHLGHFLFTHLLMDKIKASPKARIVNLTSVAMFGGKIHFDNLNLQRAYSPTKAYYQSKLANYLFTRQLAKVLKNTDITVYAVHPGLVDTELKRHLNSVFQCLLNSFNKLILISPFLGAQTTLYCAFDEQLSNRSGHYYA